MKNEFENKDEVVKELSYWFDCRKESFYNNERTKSREKFWTYNRTLQYYFSKVRRVEQILPHLPKKDGCYLLSHVLELGGNGWYEENDPELYSLIESNYYFITRDLGLEMIN